MTAVVAARQLSASAWNTVAGHAAVAAGRLLRSVRRWRHMAPGVLGSAAVSVGIGEIVGHVAGLGLAPWVSLLCGGAFALWFGAEVNRPAKGQDGQQL